MDLTVIRSYLFLVMASAALMDCAAETLPPDPPAPVGKADNGAAHGDTPRYPSPCDRESTFVIEGIRYKVPVECTNDWYDPGYPPDMLPTSKNVSIR